MTIPECPSCHAADGRPHTDYCPERYRGDDDMSERKYNRGGWIPGVTQVLVIPHAKQLDPLPSGWNPLLVIGGDECIVNPSGMRCVRSDHPHKETR